MTDFLLRIKVKTELTRLSGIIQPYVPVDVVNSVTITRSRIETSIPRKHGPAIAGYDKVCLSFFPAFVLFNYDILVI